MHWFFRGNHDQASKSRFYSFFFVIGVDLISCNLTLRPYDNALKNLTPPPIPPTRTPALSPTPESPLTLSGCAFSYECLEVEALSATCAKSLCRG